MKRGTILVPFAGLAFLSVVTISLTTACTNPSGPSLSGGSTITTFALMNPTANGTIAGTNILITAPWSTDVEAAVAAFSVSPGATITVNGVPQVSGVTANNFSSPVKYLVTAQNGSVTKYLVQVTVQTIQWTKQTDGGNSTFGNQMWSSVATGEYGTHLVATGLLQPAAGSTVHYIWTSGSAGSAWSAQTDGSNGSYANQLWSSIASSADGSHLAAVSDGSASGSSSGGSVWTSTDGGVSWSEQTDGGNSAFASQLWSSIASSADGSHLAAVSDGSASGSSSGGSVWTSTDGGVSWSEQTDGGNSAFAGQLWSSVASSTGGSHLAAVSAGSVSSSGTDIYGSIWTSTDGGATWTERSNGGSSAVANQPWSSIASSADGSHLAATLSGGDIWTSTDGGTTWTEQTDGNNSNFMGLQWKSIACSAAGNVLAAVSVSVANDETIIWTSTDNGVSWTQSLVDSSVEVSKAVAVMSADSTHIAVAGNIGAPGFGIWTVP